MGLVTEELHKLRIKCVCFWAKGYTNTFAYIFGIHLAETTFSHTDNLNKTFQSTQMTVVDVQVVSRATMKTLQPSVDTIRGKF